jgi:predicted phage terminase large subunit-like protein
MTDLGLRLPPLEEVQAELALKSMSHFMRYGWLYVDPSDYLHNWHIDVIAEHLMAVNYGQTRKLIINIPPRCLKSISTAVVWPAWTWLQKPQPLPNIGGKVRFLFSSYALTLSLRDSTKCRRLIESPWYRDLLARQGRTMTLMEDQNTKSKFENNEGGYRMATSVDGALTGEGGDIIVIDDAHNAKEVQSDVMLENVANWWDHAMSTRLNNKKTGAYVLMMQRLHHRDLVGHVLAKPVIEEGDGWVHLCLPNQYEPAHPYVYGKDPRKKAGEFLHPERIGEKETRELAADLGQYGVAGQLQQRPAPQEGGLFKRVWFKFVGALPAGTKRVRGWDFAASDTVATSNPDWTYTILLDKDRAGSYYLHRGEQFREQGAHVEASLIGHAHEDGKKVAIAFPQDPGAAGKTLAQFWTKKLAGFLVYTNTMSGSKETRAWPWKNQAEVGNFYILQTGKPAQDAWITPFLDSVCVFPNGDHDDDVDAVSLAFEAIESNMPVPVAIPAVVGLTTPFEI